MIGMMRAEGGVIRSRDSAVSVLAQAYVKGLVVDRW